MIRTHIALPLLGLALTLTLLLVSLPQSVSANDSCVIPSSGPWPPCATGGNPAPPASGGDCIIPDSGPWPPCATGGGSTPAPANGDCVIPASGPWPPCATGGGAPTPTPAAGDCVIPASGPWPPCATGGGGTTAPTGQPVYNPFAITYKQRFGVTGTPGDAQLGRSLGMNFGSYINWGVTNPSSIPDNTVVWQMIRIGQNGPKTSINRIENSIANNPGSVWVIGNEPDVQVQDNVTPDRYAEIYHDLYTFIKARDESAHVAIAGVAAPTPLRRAYLDMILNAYQSKYGAPMPIDVWSLHIYVLREQRDSWGIGIPTGMDDVNEGMLYEIEDHNDHVIANQMIADFRVWMRDRGYRNVPLAITEFGILLPADFGFGPEVVAEYMRQTVGYYLNTTNGATGFSGDGNRLVQHWFWFSLYDGTDEFAVGNLLDRGSETLTFIGNQYASYVR